MELKRARELAKTWRYQNDAWTGGSNPTLSESAIGMIILDDRITELEAERLNLRTLIRGEQIKPPFDIEDDVTTELAVALADMEKQRDELVKATMGVLKIAQNTYHSDDRGPGDPCSILENAIEKVTGKKWWDAIKQPVVDG